ncbi:methylthioribose-1-phosphate isomerase [Desertimonas flava]|uniref:methylthioribose-1-phosphate isomerase n=1 Tax=Desertimonas flava TaxID=2064846 RepID=UPI000E3569EF|nr:methylthioribose-1-phosphate isomerase [Desertimonas flava]
MTTRRLPQLADSVRLLAEDDGSGVDILDRRVYPRDVSWVHCRTVEDVATAIRDMVTQSSGPVFAAAAGMVLAARANRSRPAGAARDAMREAGSLLAATRPTNNHVRDVVASTLAVLDDPAASEGGAALVESVTTAAEAIVARYRESSAAIGRHTAALIPDGSTVLTHCWADQFLIGAVTAAQDAGKSLSFVCTETRPYLQGARLTAPTLVEMGYTPTLITDGMVAGVLASGDVDVLLTAADRVTLDGHVVNKVGTFTAALAARHAGVPYLAMVDHPDAQSPTMDGVHMEERDGAELLTFAGAPTTVAGVVGRYPAFDATPPELVTKIVTDRGAFDPARVGEYFAATPAGEVAV